MSSTIPLHDLHLDVPLDRDVFLRDLLRVLSGTLQEVIGREEAAGFVSLVGQQLGQSIDANYRSALAVKQLMRDQVAAVLIDLKRRIGGGFYVIEESEHVIVFGNDACPFGDRVLGRPVLCMMTSNVFGVIAADNLGYARVDLEETIAEGGPACRVVVHLEPTKESLAAHGREYFRDEG